MPTFILLVFFITNLVVLIKCFSETKYKKNAFGLTTFLFPLGIFVWADGVVIAPFWMLASITALINESAILFLLLVALFWVVRSSGEIMYWMQQQFSPIKRNPPEKLPFYKLFHNDSIWFVYQVFWQCVLVFSLLASIYLSWLWLAPL